MMDTKREETFNSFYLLGRRNKMEGVHANPYRDVGDGPPFAAWQNEGKATKTNAKQLTKASYFQAKKGNQIDKKTQNL